MQLIRKALKILSIYYSSIIFTVSYCRYVKVFGLKVVDGKTTVDSKHPNIGVNLVPLPFDINIRNYALLSTGEGIINCIT